MPLAWKIIVMIPTPPRFALALTTVAILVAGCASAPSNTSVAAAEPEAPVAKCRAREASIGTSIPRKDCSSINKVSTIDPEQMKDNMRVTPNR